MVVGGSLLLLLPLTRCIEAEFIETSRFKQERPPQRTIVYARRVPAAPQIDGILDEPWWEEATVSPTFFYGGSRPAAHATSLRVAFDDDALYLAAVCGFSDASALERDVPAEVHDGNVWGDDCLDLKLSPDSGGTVLQFLANANAARAESRNGDARWDAEWTCASTTGEDAYRLEMSIPLGELGIDDLRPGASLLLTCGRYDRTAGQLITAFGEPYGDVLKAAELVLGTPEEYQARLSALPLTRDARLSLYLDRDRYPSFQRLATGRVRAAGGKTGAEIQGTPAIEIALLRAGREIDSETISPVESLVLDFDWRLEGLQTGAYQIEARLRDDDGTFATANREFVVEQAPALESGRVEVTVTSAPADMPAWPVTFGVPFPWGALQSDGNIRLLDEAGREVPVQVATTGRWSRRGSLRWLLVDFLPAVGAGSDRYTIEYGPDVQRAAVPSPLMAEETDTEITVNTGPLRLVVTRAGPAGIGQVWLDGDGDGEFAESEVVLSADADSGPFMVDEAGTRFLGSRDAEVEAVLEESGPIKACVRLSGWHVSEDGDRLGKYILRIYAYRGLPYLRVFHTFIITADSDEASYRDIGHRLPFPCRDYVLGTPSVSTGRVVEPGAYLLQRDDLCFKVYDQGDFKEEGEKSEGWVTVGAPGRFLTLAVKDFWQQFPKELEVTPDALNVHFWPAHGEDPIRTGPNLSIRNVYHQWFVHEGQVLDFTVPEEVLEYVKQDSEQYNYPHAKLANAIGLAKTHEMLLYFHPRDWETARSREVNAVFQDAPAAVVEPSWVCETKVFGEMHPRDRDGFPRVERALDETTDCIMRHRVMDRDYGMFNYGDSHHNWNWAERRWSLHRIWRNTHHGWTRWPWLMYARTGEKALLDWAVANARHVADVDHCHYTTSDLDGLPYPRGKTVGGICDYKGFVHWASGGRLQYNSAADAMIWHYYLTGDRRSLTTALEHGAALLEDGKPLPHREGSGRATSAAALYFLTWDNDYLEFLERTVHTLLNTQQEDGGFPQWENFAPYLQRYVDLTRSRRAMAAMARWADWIAEQPSPPGGYHAKINILAHAYLYTGEEKYLRAAAYAVSEFVDHVYRGPDPRYRGQFIVHHTNLDQSYFMQEVPYYLTAVARLGHEPTPTHPRRTSIRALSRETVQDQERYVFHARLRQAEDQPFELSVAVRGYAGASYAAEVAGIDGGEAVGAEAAPEYDEHGATIRIAVPEDGQLEYALRVFCEQNFFVSVPITEAQPELKEVYPIFPAGTWIGDGFRFFFDLPADAHEFVMRYKGRSWPLEFNIHDPAGEVASTDVWIGSTDLSERSQRVRLQGRRPTGWSFSVSGYGQACLTGFDASPAPDGHRLYFATGPEKLFAPS